MSTNAALTVVVVTLVISVVFFVVCDHPWWGLAFFLAAGTVRVREQS